jgi:hypothetical protein
MLDIKDVKAVELNLKLGCDVDLSKVVKELREKCQTFEGTTEGIIRPKITVKASGCVVDLAKG